MLPGPRLRAFRRDRVARQNASDPGPAERGQQRGAELIRAERPDLPHWRRSSRHVECSRWARSERSDVASVRWRMARKEPSGSVDRRSLTWSTAIFGPTVIAQDDANGNVNVAVLTGLGKTPSRVRCASCFTCHRLPPARRIRTATKPSIWLRGEVGCSHHIARAVHVDASGRARPVPEPRQTPRCVR